MDKIAFAWYVDDVLCRRHTIAQQRNGHMPLTKSQPTRRSCHRMDINDIGLCGAEQSKERVTETHEY